LNSIQIYLKNFLSAIRAILTHSRRAHTGRGEDETAPGEDVQIRKMK